MRSGIIIACLALSACADQKVIEHQVLVPVVKEVYVPLPDSLFEPCEKPDPLKNNVTIGTLLDTALRLQIEVVPCLEGRLQAIRDLQPK